MLTSHRNARRSRSIRVYVARLVVAVTLPLLAFGAFLLIRAAHNEQQAIATTADERAQGAAADLDRELHNLQDLIAILATSDSILSGDFLSSESVAARMQKGGALGFAVRDLSGQSLLNTCHPDGPALPLGKPLTETADAAGGGGVYISDLTVEPKSGEPTLTIDVLARREEKPAYVLSICALPRIVQILREQHLPDDWSIMIFDREGRTIASVLSSVDLGSAAAKSDAAAAVFRREKASIAGPVYRSSSPVELAGWTVAIDVPNESFFGPVRRSLIILVAAGGGAVALVVLLAVSIGRRIADPITALAGIAEALGRGAPVAPLLTGINEADLVARALCAANEDLNRHTEELTRTVGALRNSEKRLQGLSNDLRRALDERTELLNRMVSAQEDERQRVARELHDRLGQYFAAIGLGLDAADKASGHHDQIRQRITELRVMTSAVSREAHQLSWELRPTALDDLGLEAAVASYLERWRERFEIKVDFAGNLHGQRLSAPVEITLYRVLQEAMTNVAKHANATRVSVVLEADGGETQLIVEDDGAGFVQNRPDASAARTAGFGLLGIRERLGLVGGSLIIETAPDCGTTLFCRIPA